LVLIPILFRKQEHMLNLAAIREAAMKGSMKSGGIVVLGMGAALLLATIFSAYSNNPSIDSSADYNQASQIATLENQAVNESSGIAASRLSSKVFWTHNDSGDKAFLYAFDKQGKHLGVYKVGGAEAQDWEDMAAWKDRKSGKAYLFIGDIGNNSKTRPFLTIYRLQEPKVSPKDSATTKQTAVETTPAESIKLKYPDGNFDAETLMIHPTTGDLYIVNKVMRASATVYKLKAPFMHLKEATLTRVGEIEIPNPMKGFITGGDISPDGRRVALCDYLGAYELTLPDKKAFDDIWKQPIQSVGITARKQGEAICYRADAMGLLATSEGLPCPLIEITRGTKK
jgi:hypothetical protein